MGSGSEDEIVLYGVNGDGTLSGDQLDGATSTLRGNTEGRNLPSAIGFQIVQDNYVVVTEAREFQPNGTPPAFPALQDGSVSTWQIIDSAFVAVNLDVASGENNTGRTACWLDFSTDNTFFVSNAIEAGLASYSFNDGQIALIDQVAAQGTGATGNTTDPGAAFGTTEGWIDMWISDDGQFLYQAYGLSGEVGVYAIDGTELTLLQEIGGLPSNNIQGIVSVGQVSDDTQIIRRDEDLFGDATVATQSLLVEDGTAEAMELTVYPNPASAEVLNIEFIMNGDYNISIFGIDGSVLMTKNGNNTFGERFVERVDVSEFANGLYIVQLSNATSAVNQKLIIQK